MDRTDLAARIRWGNVAAAALALTVTATLLALSLRGSPPPAAPAGTVEVPPAAARDRSPVRPGERKRRAAREVRPPAETAATEPARSRGAVRERAGKAPRRRRRATVARVPARQRVPARSPPPATHPPASPAASTRASEFRP